ncbi:hypothetical protein ACTXT7_002421 [Hymenolepis weldensis]
MLIYGDTASSAAAKTVKDTYGNDVVNEKTCRKWFSAGGFEKDDFGLKDERQTKSRMLKNSILSNWTLALMKIHREMKRLKGKVSRSGKWDPPPPTRFVRYQQATSQLAKFYEEGMRKLMARWEDVINKNGDYVED